MICWKIRLRKGRGVQEEGRGRGREGGIEVGGGGRRDRELKHATETKTSVLILPPVRDFASRFSCPPSKLMASLETGLTLILLSPSLRGDFTLTWLWGDSNDSAKLRLMKKKKKHTKKHSKCIIQLSLNNGGIADNLIVFHPNHHLIVCHMNLGSHLEPKDCHPTYWLLSSKHYLKLSILFPSWPFAVLHSGRWSIDLWIQLHKPNIG